jgi:hypothetical protein
MADYVELALVDDPDALLEVGIEYMEDAITGFVARPGNVGASDDDGHGDVRRRHARVDDRRTVADQRPAPVG